ncbi:uncharacterized protein EV154DRAFT_493141 [Mucor mucedo]|uniref:uncharacterized protein n=1 Tax=Mucor mucedo TaxID=29922 RepID=UPI0022212033|nr:uncharacterized protein EV154DRAFT_493141 [Mucor mucedo]KAI7896002.1 hypothetical protein EV154DRAFT_493141 [Mucor mucedo]
MTNPTFETHIHNEILLKSEQCRLANLELLDASRVENDDASLDENRAAIARHDVSAVPVIEKPRNINAYNAFCQQEKTKILKNTTEEVPAVPLASQILFKRYKNLTEGEHETLATTVQEMNNGSEVQTSKNTDLILARMKSTLKKFLAIMNAYDGTESAMGFGRNRPWKAIAVGENVEKMDLKKWRKEIKQNLNPGFNAKKARIVAASLVHSKRIAAVKESIKKLIYDQCGTTHAVVPWKKMVRVEDIGTFTKNNKCLVVKNWPIDNFIPKEIKKAHNLTLIESNLCRLEFELISIPDQSTFTEPTDMLVDNDNE